MQVIRKIIKIILTELRRRFAEFAFLRSREHRFLKKQIDRHFEHQGLDNAIIHSHRIIPQLRKIGITKRSKVLCIGVCNMLEIHAFKSYGYDDVLGIDLVSADKRYIKVMDMHQMKFPPNTFDVIYCSGTLHCTHDIQKLVSEIFKVAKPGAYLAICVPLGFPTNEVYRYDPKSLDNLRLTFNFTPAQIIWHELVEGLSEANPNGDPILRVIFRI